MCSLAGRGYRWSTDGAKHVGGGKRRHDQRELKGNMTHFYMMRLAQPPKLAYNQNEMSVQLTDVRQSLDMSVN